MFTDWAVDSSINYLAGSISYIFGLILWCTSLGWIRRRLFEVRTSLMVLTCSKPPMQALRCRCEFCCTGFL